MWCFPLDRHNWREYCFTPKQGFFASRERGESQEENVDGRVRGGPAQSQNAGT